jgi:hypothetical protein
MHFAIPEVDDERTAFSADQLEVLFRHPMYTRGERVRTKGRAANFSSGCR